MKTARYFLMATCMTVWAATGWAGWQLVDDFENSTLGPVTGQTAANGQVWNSLGEDSRSPHYQQTVPSFAVHAMEGGQSLVVEGTVGTLDRAWVGLDQAIVEGTVGTIYCRVKSLDDPAATVSMHINYGGYDGTDIKYTSRTATFGVINNYTALPMTNMYAGSVGGNETTKTEIQADQWYECWIVVDLTGETNGVLDPTKFYYNCYASGPGLSGLMQFNVAGNPNFLLRNYTAGNGIVALSFLQQVNNAALKDPIAFDDFYVDYAGANLSSVPEPTSMILLGLGSLVLWRKK